MLELRGRYEGLGEREIDPVEIPSTSLSIRAWGPLLKLQYSICPFLGLSTVSEAQQFNFHHLAGWWGFLQAMLVALEAIS